MTNPDPNPQPIDTCLRCGSPIKSIGIREFRTGGSSGAAKLIIGEWAELGEEKLRIEVLVCETCRHLELRAAE